MRFSLVIAIVDSSVEDKAIDIAKAHGAGGVTTLKGTGIGLNEKKTFFGLTYERAESILLFLTEKKTSVRIMKAIKEELQFDSEGKGIVMTLPVEHLAGIPMEQLVAFEHQIKEENEI